MMLGAIAAARRRLVSTGGGGAGDPRATIDFVNDVYDVDGVTLTAADVVDKPGRIGASGLEILDNDVDGVVDAIGDLLTLLLTLDWTVVIEYEEVADVDATYVLWMQETVNFHKMNIIRLSAFESNYMRARDSGTITRTATIGTAHLTGIHKIAVTRTNDVLSISVNGSAVETETADTTTVGPLDTASFGGDPTDQSYNPCFIRSLTVYAPVTDDVLRALSS